ncbi:MAG: hypothetical protein IPH73_14685 [Rhodocyclales bacterium]|nr:hypothetical protein [Rhodocyclales bacterium]
MPHFPAAGGIVIWDRSWYQPRQRQARGGQLPPGPASAIPAGALRGSRKDGGQWHHPDQNVGGQPGELERAASPRASTTAARWKLAPMDLNPPQPLFTITQDARRDLPAATDANRLASARDRTDKRRARLNIITHLDKAFHHKRARRG